MIHIGKHWLNPAHIIEVCEEPDQLVVATTEIDTNRSTVLIGFTGPERDKLLKWLELTEDKV